MNLPVRSSAPPWQPYALVFVFALAATSLLLGYFLWNGYRQTHTAVETSLGNIAQTIETRVEATLRRIENDLEHIAHDLPDAALKLGNVPRFAEQIRADLDNRTRHFPELSSYRIFDAEGNSLYNSGPVVPAYSVADRSYFQSAKANPRQRLHYSEAIVGKQTHKAVVVMAFPMTTAAGAFSGVVIGAMDMDYYNKLFSTLELGPSGVIALRRTEDGALVARWPPAPGALNVPYKTDHPMWPWLKTDEKAGTMRLTSQTDNIERLFVYRRLDNYPFFIVPGRTAGEYLSAWRQTAITSITLVVIALLIVGIFLHRLWKARCDDLLHSRTLAAALEAAQTANRAKSTFLANMSHELRTPMNAIMGMTAIVKRHNTDPKQQEQLGKIEQASTHLLSISNDILDISKIEAERMKLEQVSFKFSEVLENLISMVGQRAQAKGLKLRVDLGPELPHLTLVGDSLRLGQILLNLAGNAVKFTEQGSVTLRARIAAQTPAGITLHVEIQDTGIGIGPEEQQRLFTPFEQADGSMTRKYGGTGLGLAISRRLAELMGGEMGVTSQPGAGSSFWFTAQLGIAAQTDAESAPGAVPPAPTFEEEIRRCHAGARVLLAEDEPINREVSCSLLEDIGLTVDVAEDGRQAVTLARQTDYRVILMDMQMPNMNGVDATRAIRQLPGRAGTPILAMTANAFDDDRQACLEAGMNDHIPKPIDPDRLYQSLAHWLGKTEQERTT